MDTISRVDAHKQGRRKFFTGKPCKNGHLAERYTTSGACTQCAQAFHKMPPGPSPELAPVVLPVVYLPSVTPAQLDELGDYVAQCVVAWVEFKGLMTDGIARGYATLAKGAVESRKLRDYQIANAGSAQTLKTTAVMSDKQRNVGLFLDAIATMTGKDLDGATELIRQQGEPDNAFRARIRAKTMQHLEGVS